MSELAARVRAARGYADLTQPALADELGLERQSIVRTEAGTRDPKKAELIAIAHVCGVPVDFMLGGFGAVGQQEVDPGVDAKVDEVLRRLPTRPVDQHELSEVIERLRTHLGPDRTTPQAPGEPEERDQATG